MTRTCGGRGFANAPAAGVFGGRRKLRLTRAHAIDTTKGKSVCDDRNWATERRAPPHWVLRKEPAAVIYGEPEAVKFLLAVRRLKLQRLRRERLEKLAKQKARAALRKLRP